MRKTSITYQFLSLILAAMIFVSSVGVFVDLHYCSGEFKSSSFMSKAPSCHEPTAPICKHHQKMMEEGKKDNNCCSNKTVYFQSDQDMDIAKIENNNTLQLQNFVVAYFKVFIQKDIQLPKQPELLAYKPPPLLQDIRVLLQTFLI